MKEQLNHRLLSLFQSVIDIVYPSFCIGCKKRGAALCNTCLLSSEKITTTPFEFIHPIYSYRDATIKRALWEFKLEGKRGYSLPLASVLHDHMIETLADEMFMHNFNDPLLLSIPGSTEHSKRRGYDQGAVLCSTLSKLDNQKFFSYQKDVLHRKKGSKPQAESRNKSERIKNIAGAFNVNPSHNTTIAGKNIILVDDVTTTGATLQEARNVLLHAGAKRVLAFTIAH